MLAQNYIQKPEINPLRPQYSDAMRQTPSMHDRRSGLGQPSRHHLPPNLMQQDPREHLAM